MLAHDDEFHLSRLGFSGSVIFTPRLALAPGQGTRVRILARDVSLALEKAEHSSIQNILPAKITELMPFNAAQLTVKLDVGGHVLLARITRKSVAALDLKINLPVFAQIKSVALTP